MDVLLVNIFLYLFTLLYSFKKEKCSDVYLLIWVLYTFIAICGYVCVRGGYYYSNNRHIGEDISFIPYLFAYISFLIISYPLKYFNSSRLKLSINNSTSLKNFIYVCTPIFISVSIVKAIKAIIVSAIGYGAAYQASHDGEILYEFSNKYLFILDTWGNTFCDIFQVVYIFYFMSKIAKNQGNLILNLLFIFFGISVSIFANIATGSKGGLFFVLISLIFYYILFRPFLNGNMKKLLGSIVLIVMLLFAMIVMQITSSRIENSKSVRSETEVIISYLGETMPNLGVKFYNHVKEHPNGARFFPELFDNKYHTEDRSTIFSFWGIKTGTDIQNFKTFWGDCYIEFGLLGSFAFIILFVACWRLFVFKKCYNLYMIPLVIYYFNNVIVSGLFGFQMQGARIHLKFFYLVFGCIFLYLLLYRYGNKNKYIDSGL